MEQLKTIKHRNTQKTEKIVIANYT